MTRPMDFALILGKMQRDTNHRMDKQNDILGEMLRIQKNQLQEIRATHITLIELTRRLVPDNGEEDEEDPLSVDRPQ